MKNWLGYEATGIIRTFHIRGGGFPDTAEIDLNDPGSSEEADWIRAEVARDFPDVVAFIEYDCPCDDDAFGTCVCPQERAYDGCIDLSGTPTLAVTPVATWEVDGSPQASTTRNAPLVTSGVLSVKLVVDLPDATPNISVEEIPNMPSVLSDALPLALTITDGKSQAFNLTTPLAGLVGAVRVNTQGVHQIAALFVRGALA